MREFIPGESQRLIRFDLRRLVANFDLARPGGFKVEPNRRSGNEIDPGVEVTRVLEALGKDMPERRWILVG